jgi:transposase
MIPTYYYAPNFSKGSDQMRGPDEQTSHMFSYLSPEQRVRPDHPLRAIRRMTDEVFTALSPRFTKMYSTMGRPSIPPEQLLRALVLQSLYTVRSERLLMEEIDYSVLFRWFVGLGMDDPIWSPTTFSKNRDRLLDSDIASAFFDAVLDQARAAGLLSDEHFTVDGTLLEAWASLKSFRRKDEGPTPPPDDPGNPTVNFHGEARRNDTHQSTTDPDAMLARKGDGREAKLAYLGNVLLDNRHGLVANVCATAATGTGEREAAQVLLGASAPPGSTVGGDKNFDVRSFVAAVRDLDITPHVAQKINSAIDGRTTRHAGYAVSQRKRKLVEQVFGWMKTVGGLRKLRHRGGDLVDWIVTFTAAAYNLIRLRTLLSVAGQ